MRILYLSVIFTKELFYPPYYQNEDDINLTPYQRKKSIVMEDFKHLHEIFGICGLVLFLHITINCCIFVF